jgi:hypothetical protein
MNLTRLIINASNYLLPNRGRPHMNHDCIKAANGFCGRPAWEKIAHIARKPTSRLPPSPPLRILERFGANGVRYREQAGRTDGSAC